MRDKTLKIILPTAVLIISLILWEYLSQKELINSALFASPTLILKTILGTPELLLHIINSLMRLIIAVAIGFIFGFIVGILISDIANTKYLEDIISFFISIPGIAWAPVFVIIIGFGNNTIILVGIITAFFPVVYNIIHGMKEINRELLDIGKIFEYNSFELLFKIKIPAIMNYIVVALKLSFARTWRTIIAVEMIAATMYGLGYMIFDARELINSKLMFSGIIISGFIYYLIENVFINFLEKETVIKWGMKMSYEKQ